MDSFEEVLLAIQHHDQQTRRTGEIYIHQLQGSPDQYADVATAYAGDASKPAHLRQLTIVLTNQQVGRGWRAFNQASKEKIVQLAFNGCCSDVQRVIRHSSMLLLSKIVSQMPLSESRDIVAHLTRTLMAPDLFSISWTLRCLCAVADEVDHDLLLEVIKHAYHRILELVGTVDPSNTQVLRYAAKLMRHCVQTFGNARMQCGFDEAAMTVVSQFLASWAGSAVQWIKAHCCARVEDVPARLGVMLEMLRGVTAALEAFPDECAAAFPEAMQTSWVLLCLLRDAYFHNTLQIDAPSFSSPAFAAATPAAEDPLSSLSGYGGYSSDGDRVDLEVLVRELFQLMCAGLTSSTAATAKELLAGNLQRLAATLSEYMQLTVEQREQWRDDANEFVAAEQEESSEYSIRQTGSDLIQEVCKNGREEAFKHILFDAQQELDRFVADGGGGGGGGEVSSGSISRGGRAARVLRFEGVMWCLGCVGATYMKFLKCERRFNRRAARAAAGGAGVTPDLDASGKSVAAPKGKELKAIAVVSALRPGDVWSVVGRVIHTMLLDGTAAGAGEDADVLRGRAAWLFGVYADLIQDDHDAVRSASVALLALLGPDRALAARLQACRALGRVLSMPAHAAAAAGPPAAGFETFGLAVVEASLGLVPAMTSSTLYFALETINAALAAYAPCFDAVASSSGAAAAADGQRCRAALAQVVAVGLRALGSFSTDPLLLDVSKDMLTSVLALRGAAGVQAVFTACAKTFRTWIEIACEDGYSGVVRRGGSRKRGGGDGGYGSGSALDDDDDDDEDEDDEDGVPPLIAEGAAEASLRYEQVSPALIEVAVEISAKMAASPGLQAWAAAAPPAPPPPLSSVSSESAAAAVLTTVETLVGSLRSLSFPCRRESLQALNVIFSHLDAAAVRGVFSEPFQSNSTALNVGGAAGGAPAAAETAPRFALAIAEVLLAAMASMEADAPTHGECSGPAAGLLGHLLLHFHAVLGPDVVNALVAAALTCLRHAQAPYVRYSLLMGLVHLFARNAAVLAHPTSPLLGTIPAVAASHGRGHGGPGRAAQGKKGDVQAMSYVLDQWCSLHGHLNSRYCGVISSLGFLELIKIFNQHAVNHSFALRVLRLALSTLPRLLDPSAAEPDDEDGWGGRGLGGDDGDELEFSDGDDEYDSDYEDEWEDDDGGADGEDADGMGMDEEGDLDDDAAWLSERKKKGRGKGDNVFAPAEMYLSDVLDRNLDQQQTHTSGGKRLSAVLRAGGAGGGDYCDEDDGYTADQENTLMVNVSSSLMFSPPSRDPLAATDLEGRVVDLLVGLRGSDGLFPAWMAALTPQEQHLVQLLATSR